MALAKLQILVELRAGKLQFNEHAPDGCIVAMFNPSRLTLSTSISWPDQKAAKRDNPEQQYVGADPATVSIDLFFDTYDTPEAKKTSVQQYTDKLLMLTQVQGDKHRPPICKLKWGSVGVFFQGVLQQMERQYTMFMEDGTPVRALAKCTFKQWRTNQDDFARQNLLSADVAKRWVVKQGETLASIAAQEYNDPRKWRPIAEANGIDDPQYIRPGTSLILPPLRNP
jgi:nucleoid-associated protein YgaU